MADHRLEKLKILDRLWGPLGIIAVAAVGTWQVYEARSDAEMLTQALQSTRADLSKARTDYNELLNRSFPGFLQKFYAHVEELKKTSDAYEKAKNAKGADISGSEAAKALAQAITDLNAASDSFTNFRNLWREVAEIFNRMLDGNITQLENSRRENNVDDVDAAARKIVKEAPDLATPLRLALDKLKPSSKETK